MTERKVNRRLAGNDESRDQYENRHRLAHLGICPHGLSMLYRQRLLDGVLNHFAER